jgi:hypothetical protein
MLYRLYTFTKVLKTDSEINFINIINHKDEEGFISAYSSFYS